jgi:phosphatidylserine decarboxylase
MTVRRVMATLARHDGLNFLLTNCLPRRLAGRWVGRISRSENRLVAAASLFIWRCFADIDLADAERTRFRSMHDCFTRRLKPGARPIDPDPAVLTSPCDGIVGASGTVTRGRALQVKGMDYALAELLDDADHAAALEGSRYVTLRLTSAMYHRFHAPQDCRVTEVRHVFGDRWNVNPPTLRRVRRLFCRNERVVVRAAVLTRSGRQELTLVAVAAILVSGIRLGFLELGAGDGGPVRRSHACDAVLAKGDEMGWFEHGSTIIVLAPRGVSMADGLREGDHIRTGEPLLRADDGPLDGPADGQPDGPPYGPLDGGLYRFVDGGSMAVR